MPDADSPPRGPTNPRSHLLPSYPKAFFAQARFARERNRVFLAMPFGANHSKKLSRAIGDVCSDLGLHITRGDPPATGPIMTHVLEQLERAEITIADLTDLNENVLYEVGIAHTRCDSVILVAQEGSKGLPFDLEHMRCIHFDLGSARGRRRFKQALREMIQNLHAADEPTIIECPLKRTEIIIRDLQRLAALPDADLRDETISHTASLTALAIPRDEYVSRQEVREALFQEQEALVHLARRGCTLKCVITPPAPEVLISDDVKRIRTRIETLLKFLQKNDPAHRNTDWAVSPFRQKHMYIIGSVSCIEGYRKRLERGYGLSLRQTSLDAIQTSVRLYKSLFKYASEYTLREHYHGPASVSTRDKLRKATIKCLKQALKKYPK